uniref:Uncharacterized protein n=1 Tax=Glossina pallidipes TaxID=7398 RepID=A0A1B0A3R3_GLOPL
MVGIFGEVSSGDNKQTLQHVHKLKGHEDWVRGLDLAEVKDALLLVSCTQENFIRLWRLSPRNEEQPSYNLGSLFTSDKSASSFPQLVDISGYVQLHTRDSSTSFKPMNEEMSNFIKIDRSEKFHHPITK